MKVLVINDSTGNPRSSYSILKKNTYGPEKTFFFLLKKKYKKYTFCNISFGGVLTKKLLLEAQAYYKDWEPDIIFIHSGINDCKPKIISNDKKDNLDRYFGSMIFIIKKIIYNKLVLKFFGFVENKKKFLRDIKIFCRIFNKSKIFWLEISSSPKLNEIFPNISKFKSEFNLILINFFQNNFIKIESELILNDCFLDDHLHYNEKGHKLIFKIIEKKLLK